VRETGIPEVGAKGTQVDVEGLRREKLPIYTKGRKRGGSVNVLEGSKDLTLPVSKESHSIERGGVVKKGTSIESTLRRGGDKLADRYMTRNAAVVMLKRAQAQTF